MKTTLPQNFVVNERLTKVSHLRYMARTTTHADKDNANKLVLVLVLVLGSRAPHYIGYKQK